MKKQKSNLADNLSVLRQIKKLSQEEVAEKIGVSRQTVAKWEAGESLPDILNCDALARLYDVELVVCLFLVQLSRKVVKRFLMKQAQNSKVPAYYEDYLKEQYPDEYANPLKAFEAVGQTADFPEMSRLLKQVEAYRGNGISAGLFYEGKVAEAISLIVEWSRLQQQRKEVRKKLSVQDVQQLENLTLYLNDHCIQDIPLEQIVRISCMSARKLQTAFKEYHGCTITEYIQQRRMSQAETLLAKTDLSIGQVAQSVGYTSASRFAELFRKSTGLLPLEYRKVSQRK